MISKKVLSTLEYDKILQKLSAFLGSERAKADVLDLQPATEFCAVEMLLQQTKEADKILYEHIVNVSFSFDDIEFVLERAKVFALLTQDEILKVARVLKTARQAKSALTNLNDDEIVLLKQKAGLLYTDKPLEENIYNAIINSYEMADTASVQLKSVRQSIKKCQEEIRIKLNRFVTHQQYSKYLQDNVITMREGRHVIMVKSECKGAIPGLVHGSSASGSTLYVEPMAIFELNNKLKGLMSDEAIEIERILRDFSAAIGAAVDEIRHGFELLCDLDIIFAKAAYAKSINAVCPTLSKHKLTNIISGRHPLIDSKKVVPVSLYIGKDFKILMITGPNTGGKTVTLKLLGLLTLMAQSGMFIPAGSDSVIGVFSGVYSGLGDEQSIEQSLSTFSSHMVNVINILQNIDEDSLVLLDELCAGTDPSEGAALAMAIVQYLLDKKSTAVITTHYNQLKEFSMTAKGVKNASMDFDPETFAPTFGLKIGMPGASNAIKIAERLGLMPSIVNAAEGLLGQDRLQFEKIIASATSALKTAQTDMETATDYKQQISQELQKIKAERSLLEQERQAFNRDVKQKVKEIAQDAAMEAEEITARLKQLLKQRDDEAYFEANRLKKRLHDIVDEKEQLTRKKDDEIILNDYDLSDENISEGDAVFIKSLQTKGQVLAISGSHVTVQIGALKTHIKLNDLRKIIDNKKSKNDNNSQVSYSKTFSADLIEGEINLLGKSVDEAIYEVDIFIDRAVSGGLDEVRIVHGVGTGALYKGIHQHLRGHKNAKLFRFGKYGEGEKGVTILTLK